MPEQACAAGGVEGMGARGVLLGLGVGVEFAGCLAEGSCGIIGGGRGQAEDFVQQNEGFLYSSLCSKRHLVCSMDISSVLEANIALFPQFHPPRLIATSELGQFLLRIRLICNWPAIFTKIVGRRAVCGGVASSSTYSGGGAGLEKREGCFSDVFGFG